MGVDIGTVVLLVTDAFVFGTILGLRLAGLHYKGAR
jgi:hypothetical protein